MTDDEQHADFADDSEFPLCVYCDSPILDGQPVEVFAGEYAHDDCAEKLEDAAL